MKNNYRFLILLLVVLTMSSCARRPVTRDKANENVSDALNAFALDIYHKLPAEQGNVFISPFSVANALGMTMAGASGNTLHEMSTAMHVEGQASVFHGTMNLMNADLSQRAGADITLSLSNALWLQNDYPFRKEFLKTVNELYRAEAINVDFRNAGEREKSRLMINERIALHTKGRIEDLIPAGLLNENTRLVLTNAIYFLGAWKTSFDKDATANMPFWTTATSSVDRPFMNGTGTYQFFQDEQVQVLELPYAGGQFSMLMVLPRKLDGLKDLKTLLGTEQLKEWRSALKDEKVVLGIPKFSITGDYDLSKPLQELGIRDAFSLKADFSLMTGNDELFIDAVLHKAFVEVNEEGTEAAAATAVIMAEKVSQNPVREYHFMADHPFFFFIIDRSTGTILFMGELKDPSV